MEKEKYYLLKELIRKIRESNGRVRIYLTNGYQMVGRLGIEDDYSFYIFDEGMGGKKRLVFFHVLSTIEEEETPPKCLINTKAFVTKSGSLSELTE